MKIIKTNLTLGSLFSGSGTFEFAARLCGITPLWNSEVEPFPIAVTLKHFPTVDHLGDISCISGKEVVPVDIISFSSPCQDLSIAGKRDGLDGNRSSLFYEAIRIITEMRRATNEQYPRWIIWENVPGAFSSNNGEDFKSVLESICQIKKQDISIPKPEKWSNAGEIVGEDFSLCWRVLDAQYFGVPQRRKRIFLIADFASERAGEILFESESLPRHTDPCKLPWQTAAGSSEKSLGKASVCLNDQGGQRMDISNNVTNTLRAESHHPPCVLYENHGMDTRFKGPLDIAPSVLSTYGTGGNNQPFVLELPKAYGVCSKNSNSMKSDNPNSGFYETDTARTLDGNGGNPCCNQGGMAVVAIEGNGTRPSHKGDGYSEDDVSFTLNATEKHGVAYGLSRSTFSQGQNSTFGMDINKETQPTITANGPGGVAQPVYSTSKASFHTKVEENISETLVASDYKDPPTVSHEPDYIVRRLTPTECARLMGFPDDWCDDLGISEPSDEDIAFWTKVFETYARINGKKPKTEKQIIKWLQNPYTDSAAYKMWGNGVCLNCAYYILSNLTAYSTLTGTGK